MVELEKGHELPLIFWNISPVSDPNGFVLLQLCVDRDSYTISPYASHNVLNNFFFTLKEAFIELSISSL